MTVVLAILIIVGSLLAAWGAIDAYRGRMREEPPGSGLYTVPSASPRSLVIGILGAVIALASGLLGLFAV